MRFLITLSTLFAFATLYGQTPVKFDIVSYQAPKGWTKEEKDFAVSFVKVNNISRGWCRISLYRSAPSSGNPTSDFANEWKVLVDPTTYTGATQPQPQSSTRSDGWTVSAGGSEFKWEGKPSAIILTNFSAASTMLSILVSMNSDEFEGDVETFLKSLILDAPPAAPTQAPESKEAPTVSTPTTQVVTVTHAPSKSGIATSTTNFNDGWVAQPFADYVQVTKGSVTVLLHYVVDVDDGMRAANNMATVFWDRLIAPRYRFGNLFEFKNEPYTYNRIYFLEGDVTEVSSGKNLHVGLRVLVASGRAWCIELIAPNSSEFQKVFPNQDVITAMQNYNKFAVSASDLVGHWTESSSTAVQMYNTTTGSYAGMNASARANTFDFANDGSYSSHHSGGYGMVGSMTTYDQKYKGKFTLTPWSLTITNRFDGKTEAYDCQYEAIRNGRILHMRQKEASAMTYDLVQSDK